MSVIWEYDDGEAFLRLRYSDDRGYWFEHGGDSDVIIDSDDLHDLKQSIHDKVPVEYVYTAKAPKS